MKACFYRLPLPGQTKDPSLDTSCPGLTLLNSQKFCWCLCCLYFPVARFLPELLPSDAHDGRWSPCRCGWWSLGCALLQTLNLIFIFGGCNDDIASDHRGHWATEPTEDLAALQLEGPGGFLHPVMVGISCSIEMN